MDFKFLTWYYDREVDTPRDYMFVLPVKSKHGFYGWKYSCWKDMPTELNLAYSFANIEADTEWREKWKYQFGEGNPNLSSKNKQQMIQQLFMISGFNVTWY